MTTKKQIILDICIDINFKLIYHIVKKAKEDTEQMKPMSLAAARVDARLTQEDVAKALKVAKNTIVAWEKGTTEPKVSQMKELCKLYGRPVDDIILPMASSEN